MERIGTLSHSFSLPLVEMLRNKGGGRKGSGIETDEESTTSGTRRGEGRNKNKCNSEVWEQERDGRK